MDEAGSVQLAEYADIASEADIREEIRTQQEILRKRRMLDTEAQPAIVSEVTDDVVVAALSRSKRPSTIA